MNWKTGAWLYLRNALLFQLLGVPACIAVSLMLDFSMGLFPNPLMPLGAWLRNTLKIFSIYGVTGGLALSLLHTWIMNRRGILSPAATLRRSLIYAGAIALAEAIPLFLLLWGSWAPFVILIPGALIYGWFVGRLYR